jgi:hypothetical protein
MKTIPSTRVHYFALAAALCMAVFALPSGALAHAFLDHAEPKVGAEIGKTPTEIKLWFTQDVEASFSKIEVTGPDGKQIDKKDSHLDANSKSILIVSVPALAPGVYKVQWHIVSADTHHTKGDFKFTVKG